MKNWPAYKEHFPNVVNIGSSLFHGVTDHYQKTGLQYVEVPLIVGITGACENVDTLFKVGNRLELPLFFAQTGQLALEQALQHNHGVYTVIHSGRDEETEDPRHLRQFRLTEEEFDCTLEGMTRATYDENKMYEALLIHVEKATKAMIRAVIDGNHDILTKIYKRDIGILKEILVRPYLRITYKDAMSLLQRNGYPDLVFGDDLGTEHEAKIVELVNKHTKQYGQSVETCSPVFIMKYPKEIKFFNMKVSEKDTRVVLSADCVFPFSGEAVGSAVREHDGVKLLVRLLTSTMYRLHEQRGGVYDDFRWYTEGMILSQQTLPHAGYGIGNERIVQFILGSDDIRQCSIFSLMNEQTKDWDTNRRGVLPMMQHKKTILLSIGKEENKQKLLPFLQRIKHTGHIFYATDKTYEYIEKNGVPSTLVHKIGDRGRPNLKDLLGQGLFDIIINIPTYSKDNDKEATAGKFIRTSAIETGTTLVTDVHVAELLLEKLAIRAEAVN